MSISAVSSLYIKPISNGIQKVAWFGNVTGDGSGGIVTHYIKALPNLGNLYLSRVLFFTNDTNAQSVEADSYAMENMPVQVPIVGNTLLTSWGSYYAFAQFWRPSLLLGKNVAGGYPMVTFYSANTNTKVYYVLIDGFLLDDAASELLVTRGVF